MTNFNIKTFTGSIRNQSIQLINARELHEFLQISTRFDIWISRRITDYNFIENLDFIGVIKFGRTEAGFFGSREIEVKEYHITLDMAKELCMLERSELGQQARRYFIKMEKKAILEIPRLQAENHALKQQLLGIPTFLRQNPQELGTLLTNARKALFVAHPECEKIVLYREMGLNNSEIAKLLDLGKKALENRLRKLFDLGLLQRRQTPNTQLALFQ